jgi:DNA-binding NarL/FixJ family response regulator
LQAGRNAFYVTTKDRGASGHRDMRLMAIPNGEPKLLVLDVHSVWLRAVERIVTEAGFATTATSSAGEALTLLRRSGFDVVMFGIDAGRANFPWTKLLSRCKKLAPAARFVLVGDDEDPEVLRRAREAGVDAYLTRRAEPEDLVYAIRQVLAPALFLVWPLVASRDTAEGRAARRFGLTRRENEALSLIVQGRSNAQIARELGITEQTVKGHLWRLYRKLGVTNRSAAARRVEELARHGESSARARPR